MQRRLVRNTHNEVFGGVCSGIANYFGWDPTWVRVGAALSIIFFAGTPILIYIILWIVIPADTTVYPPTTWGPNNYQTGYSQGYQQGYDQAWQQDNYNSYEQGYQQGQASQQAQDQAQTQDQTWAQNQENYPRQSN